MKHTSLLLLALPLLVLAGCKMDRDAADARLEKACSGAINAFLPEGENVENVNSKNFSTVDQNGAKHRKIEMNVTVSDGYHAHDMPASCIFFEEFVLGGNHKASIYNLDMNGEIIGQDGYTIRGDIESMEKLTKAVEDALR